MPTMISALAANAAAASPINAPNATFITAYLAQNNAVTITKPIRYVTRFPNTAAIVSLNRRLPLFTPIAR